VRADESLRRLGELRRLLSDLSLDGVVLTEPSNVRYLSGFSGSLGYLLVGQQAGEIIGDSRYWLQMEEEAPAFALTRSGASPGLWPLVAERVRAHGFNRVGFESQHLTVDMYNRLRDSLPSGLHLEPTRGLVEDLRMRKTPQEIQQLRRVAEIAGRAFDRVRRSLRPGLRERDVAFLLEQSFRELGADGPSFPTIVAAGERGALPHGRASDRIIEQGEMVVIDFGAQAGGYNSDTTRTVVLGQPRPEQRRLIEAVAEAQRVSLAMMRPGVAAASIDRKAREVAAELVGAEHAFGHGLGHGIGLMVHERPYLSASDNTLLQQGMVVTNEPGAYVPGFGGVRLEEMVLITETGYEVISPASTQVAVE
jgi:Xaa-Pro aminopeptidase